jgi:hypothetical protein
MSTGPGAAERMRISRTVSDGLGTVGRTIRKPAGHLGRLGQLILFLTSERRGMKLHCEDI